MQTVKIALAILCFKYAIQIFPSEILKQFALLLDYRQWFLHPNHSSINLYNDHKGQHFQSIRFDIDNNKT